MLQTNWCRTPVGTGGGVKKKSGSRKNISGSKKKSGSKKNGIKTIATSRREGKEKERKGKEGTGRKEGRKEGREGRKEGRKKRRKEGTKERRKEGRREERRNGGSSENRILEHLLKFILQLYLLD